MSAALTIVRHHIVAVAAFAAALAFAGNGAAAQPGNGPPNALQGFSQNRGEPG